MLAKVEGSNGLTKDNCFLCFQPRLVFQKVFILMHKKNIYLKEEQTEYLHPTGLLACLLLSFLLPTHICWVPARGRYCFRHWGYHWTEPTLLPKAPGLGHGILQSLDIPVKVPGKHGVDAPIKPVLRQPPSSEDHWGELICHKVQSALQEMTISKFGKC